jgi:phosphomethylpyrimidine synthase
MTLVTKAKQNDKNVIFQNIIKNEPLNIETLLDYIARGLIVVPKNKNHNFMPRAVGKGTYIKVNANIGISSLKSSLEDELKKLETAINAGADSVMDLSVCKDTGYMQEIRREIISISSVMVGTVPIYEACVGVVEKSKSIHELKEKDFLEVIKKQAEDGVDFMTIHAGVTKEVLAKLYNSPRVCGIVSRGGSIIAEWMKYNKKENPYYTMFDEILDIAYEYDITLSLGDGLRPGATADGTDRPQIQELIILGELVDRSRNRDVQVMVEGPGHIRLSDVEMNIKLQKRLCNDAPFYVLGPLVTDIAPGYDHITSAIGGTLAGIAGADFICYVTPSEHLSLPDLKDVHDGVIASKIAGHAADIALNKGTAREIDKKMSLARREVNWQKMADCAIDKEKVLDAIKKYDLKNSDECTMCGEYCAMKRDYDK